MAVDVETASLFLLCSRLPQCCGPLPKSVLEDLSPSPDGKVREKPLRVPIAVGSVPSCQQSECLIGVATQVSRSSQADDIEKE
jgi:hypothetical protein